MLRHIVAAFGDSLSHPTDGFIHRIEGDINQQKAPAQPQRFVHNVSILVRGKHRLNREVPAQASNAFPDFLLALHRGEPIGLVKWQIWMSSSYSPSPR